MRRLGPVRLGSLTCAALLSTGCTWDALRINLPEFGEGRAAAVALEVGVDGRLDRVESVSLFDRTSLETRGPLPFDLVFGVDADARVTLFEYPDGLGLEDFGYESGKLERGGTQPLTLYGPSIRELRISEGEPGEWRARAEPSLDGPLADFRFQDQQPTCACLTGRTFQTRSSTSSTSLLLQLGPRRVVVGTEDGRLYWVRPDGPPVDFTPTQLPFATNVAQGRVVGGGVVLSESSFVVSDFERNFWRFDLDDDDRVRSTTLVGRIPPGDPTLPTESNLFRARWMSYVPPLIYWLDLSGRFGWLNHETSTSSVVHAFGWQPAFQYGGVAYAPERDEVVAASVQSSALARLRSGVLRIDSRFEQVESLGCATFHPTLGWFVGTANSGWVHRERLDDAGSTWTSCNSQLGNGIGAIVPFRDGFIAGSTQGFIEQYSARDGWCDKLQPASNSIRFMVPYDTDESRYVVTGPKLEERMQLYSTVTVLEVKPQGECESIRNPGNDPRATCPLVSP